ncbi:MAG: ATP-binding protein [Phycisphaerae bacterium]|jgi:signal transduction histidine kinase
MKIREKIISGYISIILLICIIGYFSIYVGKKMLTKTVEEYTVAMAHTTLDKIDRVIQGRVEQIETGVVNLPFKEVLTQSNEEFGRLDNIQGYISQKDKEWTSVPKKEITAFMQTLIDNELSEELRQKIEIKKYFTAQYGYNVFTEVFVTNKYGANVAQSQKTTDYYQADEQWWQEAARNGTYLTDVEYDESSDIYSIAICRRIDDENGKFIGVLKAVLNIKEVINILKETATSARCKTEKYDLFTKNGGVIYSTREKLSGLSPRQLSDFHLEGEKENYSIVVGGITGESRKLITHAHSKGYKNYKGFGWILLVEQDVKEIFAPAVWLTNRLLPAIGMIVLLSVAICIIISRHITNPIVDLSAAALRIGQGDMNARMEVASNDEVGQLAVIFNKMVDNLKKSTTSIDNLNQEIAQRKKVEKALENSNSELTNFVYVASHDLREPLRKISSFGQLLQDSLQGKLSGDELENLNFMIDGSDRMTLMINGLLTYSRANTKDIMFEAVDLNEVVEQLKKLELGMLLEETGSVIEVPQPLPKVYADPVQMEQLLQNLIANSIKYRKDGVTPRITINAKDVSGDKVRIEIQDNGIGIASEYRDEIFKMFKRLHSRQKYDGCGIGLSVCKKIVEKHGGLIGVESEPGAGSTFWFTISLAKEAVPACEAVAVS